MGEDDSDRSHGFDPLLQCSLENDMDFYHLTAHICDEQLEQGLLEEL